MRPYLPPTLLPKKLGRAVKAFLCLVAIQLRLDYALGAKLDKLTPANPARQEGRYRAGERLVVAILWQLADEVSDAAKLLAWSARSNLVSVKD